METSHSIAVKVVLLVSQGVKQRNVAKELNLSKSKVNRIYQRYRQTGSYDQRPGSARPKKTTAQEDRFAVMTSLRNRDMSGVEVQQQLVMATGVDVSP